MSLRNPLTQLPKRALGLSQPRSPILNTVASNGERRRRMATVVPPVSQDSTSSKGPTAMVFLNMGGPSTTDEVGDFLSRLFVR